MIPTLTDRGTETFYIVVACIFAISSLLVTLEIYYLGQWRVRLCSIRNSNTPFWERFLTESEHVDSSSSEDAEKAPLLGGPSVQIRAQRPEMDTESLFLGGRGLVIAS